MSLTVHLLGQPCLERSSGDVYRFRSRKSWALLAFLILVETPPSRIRLAELLFGEADDPLRALRWSLSEVRRGLGEHATVDGDPVELRFASGTQIDVRIVTGGTWVEAVRLPGLGEALLGGMALRDAPAFETWLLSEQHHIAAASEAMLHEAALASLARHDLDSAIRFATRATAMGPLDENHHALLIRLYRLAGNNDAAQRQLGVCEELFDRELGIAPGPAIRAALRETPRHGRPLDEASIAAIIEAGSAAVSAGAVDAGIASLKSAVGFADASGTAHLRVSSRLILAETLIHSLRGLDEEGLANLHEADEISQTEGHDESAASARAEIGYVDFLRGRYDRSLVWLTDAHERPGAPTSLRAKTTSYLGSVHSDRGNYRQAVEHLGEAVELSRSVGDRRREAYATSMLGRIHLLRSELGDAETNLTAAVALAEEDHWLAFVPWPQAMLGEVRLAIGDITGAAHGLGHAFARACQVGDPCWEGMAARGLALVAEADGRVEEAFTLLADARIRANRLADPYVWLDAYILDAAAELGRRHGHPETRAWVEAMYELASRTGMRELTVRALAHSAALGKESAAATAVMLAETIDNPALQIRLDQSV
jgi:DNA-binding SARP family transcriptional activator